MYPAGVVASTAQNFKAAAEGEKLGWGTLYHGFAETAETAETAEKESFKGATRTFRKVAKVEAYHERRYLKLLANVEQGKVFKKDTPIKWRCRNCGYVHEGPQVPEKCPVSTTREATMRFGAKTTKQAKKINGYQNRQSLNL
jgi:rubrerythrin